MMPNLDGGSAEGTPTNTSSFPATTQILLDVRQQLQDEGGTSYDDAYLIPYMNLAIQEIIRLKPHAYPITKDYSLVAGSRQAFGTTELWMVDVICNMDEGSTQGSSVTILPRRSLDVLIPNWQKQTASDTVKHVIRDEFDPHTFYVFPPQPVDPSQKLKMIFSEFPDPIEDSDDTFPLDDTYRIPCLDYMLSLALREETTIPNSQAKADKYLNLFYADMGIVMPQDKRKQ